MRISAGLPTGMEGLTYPIPFSDPENVIRSPKRRSGSATIRFGATTI
jgi:hypothetical protein